MLRELYEYGVQHLNEIESDPIVLKKHIDAYIRLDKDGNFITVEKTEEGTYAECPNGGTWAGSDLHAVPFVNKCERIMPKIETKKRPESVKKGHQIWLKYMEDACEKIENAETIRGFIRNWEQSDSLQHKILGEFKVLKLKPNTVMSFKIDRVYILDMLDWKDYMRNLVAKPSSKKKVPF